MEASPTLKADNEFIFTCPIFETDVKIRDCMSLRDAQYRGQTINVRKGCQACISAGKCPAAIIVQKISFGHPDPGYYSKTPQKGRLDLALLDQVSRIHIHNAAIRRFPDMSEAHMAKIQKANDLATKSVGKPRVQSSRGKQAKIFKAAPEPETDAVELESVSQIEKPKQSAEKSQKTVGLDMADVVNKAVEKEAKS